MRTPAEKNDLARLEEGKVWKEMSVSTDFGRSPHTRSDRSEPTSRNRPTDVPPFRAAQNVGARFAFLFRWIMSKDRFEYAGSTSGTVRFEFVLWPREPTPPVVGAQYLCHITTESRQSSIRQRQGRSLTRCH